VPSASSGFAHSLKVSAFEQTRPEKVITLGWIGIPDWKLLGKLLATREPKLEFLADVGTFFPIVSSEFQPGSGERAKVFVVSLD
jgi:hypothetical protein